MGEIIDPDGSQRMPSIQKGTDVLPYGYVRNCIRDAKSKSPTAKTSASELLALSYKRIKEQADKFRIKGMTPARVMGIAIQGFQTAIKDYDFDHEAKMIKIGDGDPDTIFPRFALLVVRRRLATALKEVAIQGVAADEVTGEVG